MANRAGKGGFQKGQSGNMAYSDQEEEDDRPRRGQQQLFEPHQKIEQRIEDLFDRVAVGSGEVPVGAVEKLAHGDQAGPLQLRKLG